MVQKLAVRNQKAVPLKVSNKLGLRTSKQPGSGKNPVRKIGVLPPKQTVVKNYGGVRGEPIQFGLPSFGNTEQPVNTQNMSNEQLLDWYNKNSGKPPIDGFVSGIGGQNDPFVKINDLIENLNDPQTYIIIVGYIVAVFLIAISLYGIVTGTKQQVVNSVIGQNTSGLVNNFKPGKKKK